MWLCVVICVKNLSDYTQTAGIKTAAGRPGGKNFILLFPVKKESIDIVYRKQNTNNNRHCIEQER